MTRRLAREEGLLVGGSCGMAVVAALRRRAGPRPPDDVVVVLLPDGGRGYLSKIFNDDVDGVLRLPARRRRARPSATCCAPRAASCPALVHTHPTETVRDAIEILREYGVSQMPVVKAEPPVMAGEVAGAVSPSATCWTRCSPARRTWPTRSASTWARRCRWSARASRSPTARHALEDARRVMVIEDGKPVGVLTRADLLGFLAD